LSRDTSIHKPEAAVAGLVGTMRRFALTPSFDSVTFGRRGFPPSAPAVSARLEAIPQSVILGFEFGIATTTQEEIVRRLDLVEEDLRGFAYEGATMALTIRDVMGSGRRRLAQKFLLGPASPHIFLAFIGIGFAMARLPRPLWSRVVPDLGGHPYFPASSWLAVDGYGFDRAYFDTARWVDRQYLPPPYPWQGEAGYFPRAIDQGIGRALWFINGADVPRVAAAVRQFDPARRPDLWSGVGLAAAFAGGADQPGIELLRKEAGDLLPEVAQGTVFAAKARDEAGQPTEHTAMALDIMCGMTLREAADLADSAATQAASDGGIEYEAWRERTRRRFRR
jgi:hypothetical protein